MAILVKKKNVKKVNDKIKQGVGYGIIGSFHRTYLNLILIYELKGV